MFSGKPTLSNHLVLVRVGQSVAYTVKTGLLEILCYITLAELAVDDKRILQMHPVSFFGYLGATEEAI